jgi:hypothetical protein
MFLCPPQMLIGCYCMLRKQRGRLGVQSITLRNKTYRVDIKNIMKLLRM